MFLFNKFRFAIGIALSLLVFSSVIEARVVNTKPDPDNIKVPTNKMLPSSYGGVTMEPTVRKLVTLTPKYLHEKNEYSGGVIDSTDLSGATLKLSGVDFSWGTNDLNYFFNENKVYMRGGEKDDAYAFVQISGGSDSRSETFHASFEVEAGVGGFDDGFIHIHLGSTEVGTASCKAGIRNIETDSFILDISNSGYGSADLVGHTLKMTMDEGCSVYFKSVSLYQDYPNN